MVENGSGDNEIRHSLLSCKGISLNLKKKIFKSMEFFPSMTITYDLLNSRKETQELLFKTFFYF